jgi:hypothetical protein
LTLLTISFYLLFSPAQLLNATPIWLLGESMSIRPAEFAHDEALAPSSSSLPILPGSRQRNAPAGGFRGPSLGGAAAAVFPAVKTSGESQSELELLALLALVVAAYGFFQFIFAGDLAVLPPTQSPSPSSSSASKSTASKQQQSSTSSRYAEELHTLFTAQSRWLTFSGLRMLGSAILVAWIYVFHSHSSALTSTSSATTTGISLLANRVTFTVALSDMLFWGYLWTVLKDEGRQVATNVAIRRAAEEDD